MKEFDYDLEDIFTGVSPKKVNQKSKPNLLSCHNIEPVDGDYQLHEFVIDMDTDSYNWGNA